MISRLSDDGNVYSGLALTRIPAVHLTLDNILMCISISPGCTVLTFIGCLKRKSAIATDCHSGGGKNFTDAVFWARGYFVSVFGLNKAPLRDYIRNQEREDELHRQMKLNVTYSPLMICQCLLDCHAKEPACRRVIRSHPVRAFCLTLVLKLVAIITPAEIFLSKN